jgi:hypothetical protein
MKGQDMLEELRKQLGSGEDLPPEFVVTFV